MRRKIFDIYKALRHFGVSATEVQNIAIGYRSWLDNPIEKMPPFNTVYFLGNKLYSMPFPKGSLDGHLIGIEISGVVYLTGWWNCVHQNEIAIRTQALLNDIAKKFPTISQFEVRLPTPEEAKLLPEKTEKELINFDIGHLYEDIYGLYSDVWITPSSEHPERTFATVQENSARPHKPSENTEAVLYLVTRPKEGQMFFGEVDDYGVPTPETKDAYSKLFKILCKNR